MVSAMRTVENRCESLQQRRDSVITARAALQLLAILALCTALIVS
jgi:hypothetical protein